MNRCFYSSLFILLLLTASLIEGCAGTKQNTSSGIEDRPTLQHIESMMLLPIASDTRLPEDSRQKILAEIHERVSLDLALKGYVLEKADYFSESQSITPETVVKMSVEELALLGPSDTQYIVLCILKDFHSSSIGIAQSADARTSAMIIDKKTQKVIWKNEGQSSLTNSILNVGYIVMLLMDEESQAIARSISDLFSTIPDKPLN